MSSERSSVVVTGGAGFIGSELVRQLVARGDRVVIVDNLVNGTRENVADVLSSDAALRNALGNALRNTASSLGASGNRASDNRASDDGASGNAASGSAVLIEADVRDLDVLVPYLREARVVYHLACLGVRHSLHSPQENHDVNATATLRLLAASREAGVPRFVYVSSSEVYGTAKWAPMTEDHPTFPCTVYGASKLAGECYARAYHSTYAYPTVVVRPFNTFGPRSHHEGDSGEVIPKFLLRCLAGRPLIVFGDGTQTRDFTFVSDTAAGILLAGDDPRAVGQTINLGSGSEVTINDLATQVAQVAGRPGAVVQHDGPRPGDVLRLYADMSHARALLGYSPRTTLADGLRALLAWYQAQPTTPEQLLEREVVRNWAAPATTSTTTSATPSATPSAASVVASRANPEGR